MSDLGKLCFKHGDGRLAYKWQNQSKLIYKAYTDNFKGDIEITINVSPNAYYNDTDECDQPIDAELRSFPPGASGGEYPKYHVSNRTHRIEIAVSPWYMTGSQFRELHPLPGRVVITAFQRQTGLVKSLTVDCRSVLYTTVLVDLTVGRVGARNGVLTGINLSSVSYIDD